MVHLFNYVSFLTNVLLKPPFLEHNCNLLCLVAQCTSPQALWKWYNILVSFQCLLCVYISHNKSLNYSSVAVIPLPKSLFDNSHSCVEVSELSSNSDLCLLMVLSKGHKAHSLPSGMQSIPAFSEVQVLTNNTAAMYYFMRQEGTWLFGVIGAVIILLQQKLYMFLAFRAPWQISRPFLGTQGNMP